MQVFFSAILLGSFLLSYILLPKIIGLVKAKSLMDNPNNRSSHEQIVPTLGGAVFYIVLMLGFYFTKSFDHFHITELLIPGILILFFVGLKDDLMLLSPFTKFGAQILACFFVLASPLFQISSLPISSLLDFSRYDFLYFGVAMVFMIYIINAFNFIDGIDGLAGGVSLVVFSSYVLFFSITNDTYLMAIYTLLIGSIIAFLMFNLSRKKKIFMGDTGSLILGFMIAVGAIKLIVVGKAMEQKLPFTTLQYYLILLSIVIIPAFDSSRVIVIRLLNKKSPFYPDRNHIHHVLLDRFNLSHIKTTLILICLNLIFILLTVLSNVFLNTIQSFILFISLILILIFIFHIFRVKK